VNISVVIVSYNSEKFLEKNLQSLVHQTVKFKQIVVVDNHSADDSLQVIEAFKNEVDIIKLSYNSGYAKAANIGIKNTDSDLLLVANSDIILDENFNAAVLEKFRENKDIAMLSPLILRFDRKTIDSAGQACSLALYPSEIGFNRAIDDIPIDERPVFSVCGAATVFNRQALERLKINDEYYDEDFFIFWEDFDIGWRAHLLGLKTLFYPKAVVYHYRSGTLKQNFLSRFSLALARPAAIKYHLVKNRYLTLIKNFHFKQNFKSIPFVFFKDIIWVSLLTFASPKIIIPLMKSGKYIKKAFKKRKLIRERIKHAVSDSPPDQQTKDPNE
jgi:GT2 family glycosyltransferase